MLWIYPAIIALVMLSLGTLLERLLMKDNKSDPIAYATLFQFLLGFTSLIMALSLGKFILPHNAAMIPRFILSAFLWAGSTTFGFQAMKRLGAGEVTILGSAGTVITVILSVLILQEHVSLKIMIGICLIIISSIVVVSQKISFKSRAGILFALLSAGCASFGVINDSIILKTYEAFSYTTIMSFLPGLILLTLYPFRIRQNPYLLHPKQLSLLLIFSIIYSIQAIAYYLALEKGAHLSQLSPLIKTSTVLTVALAAIFLKERSRLPYKIGASIAATIGAVLVG